MVYISCYILDKINCTDIKTKFLPVQKNGHLPYRFSIRSNLKNYTL